MAIQLDHTIVNARDKHESASFWAEVLGLRPPTAVGHFVAVDVAGDLSFDFADASGAITPQHYAFRVSDPEFDAVFSRITARRLPYWADPMRSRPDEIRTRGESRGFYFEDPSGHFLEV